MKPPELPSPEHTPESGSHAHVVRLVATGEAATRAELARILGLAPSTVSTRVQELIDAGILVERGDGPSSGGRPPRLLEVSEEGGYVLAADVGTHHVHLGMLDLSGSLRFEVERRHTLAADPEVTLRWLLREFTEIGTRPDAAGGPLRGVGVALPGPVDFPRGRVVSPSRMAGWHDAAVRDWLAARLPVPVVVDNDANLMAVGEHLQARPDLDDLLLVKLGTGIGCGIISGGRLHRGASGAAGDISHVAVSGEKLCGCGRRGCLETVASGAALAAAFEERGTRIDHPTDVVRLVQDGDANATELVRAAGRMVGEVLSVVVNFFNPQAVILGGALAAADPLVASLRATLYERCLPLATQDLEITTARTGLNAGIVGAGLQALQSGLPIAPTAG